jgi:hypothetical protein
MIQTFILDALAFLLYKTPQGIEMLHANYNNLLFFIIIIFYTKNFRKKVLTLENKKFYFMPHLKQFPK